MQGSNAVGGVVGRHGNGTLIIKNFANRKTETDKLGNVKQYYSPFSVSSTADNAGGLVGSVDGGSVVDVEDITFYTLYKPKTARLRPCLLRETM